MTEETKQLTVSDETRAGFKRLATTFQQMLPKAVPWSRFRIIALNMLLNRRDLDGCLTENPNSVWGALIQAAQIGLMPDGLQGEAYILPFKNKGVPTATLVPGYRGYLVLGRRSGQIKSFHAMPVYEKDRFEYHFGLEGDHLLHEPTAEDEPGQIVYAYAIARLTSGGYQMVVLPRREIERAHASSKQSEGFAWKLWYPEMAQKTALRRLSRLMPMSSELQIATTLDSASEGGADIDLSYLMEDVKVDGAAFVKHDEEAPSKQDKLKDKLKEVVVKDQGGSVAEAAAEIRRLEEEDLELGAVEHRPSDEGNPFSGWNA